MSRTSKVIMWIVVILILIIIGKVLLGGKMAEAPSDMATTTSESAKMETGEQASAKDTTDAALEKDLASVEAAFSGLNSDSATADAALSAK